MTLSPDLSALRSRFPALARTQDGRPVVFADAPGGSQVPDTVIDAVEGHYRGGISNMDGVFAASEDLEATVAAARRAGADLVGADPRQIVFGANSTSLLFHLSRSFARTIGPGDEVVVTRLDHDANVRPWVLAARDAGATVRWVDVRPDDATLDIDSFDEALERGPALVAFTLASNAVGTVTPGRRPRRPRQGGGRARRRRRRARRPAPLDRSGAPRGRHRDRLAVQGLRAAHGHGRRDAGGTRRMGPLPRAPGRALPVARALGDRHAEPRGHGRLRRRGRLPRRHRHDVRPTCRRFPSRRGRHGVRCGRGARACARAALPRRDRRDRRGASVRHRRSRPARRPHADVRGARRATVIRARRRRRSPTAASTSGTGTTTRSSSSTGSACSTPAGRCASGSATTTPRTRSIACSEALAELA